MSKKIKTLIAALAVLALLGGGYFGATVYQKKKAAAAAAAASTPLVSVPAPKLGNLETIKLVRMENPDIVVEKKDGRWELASLNGAPPPEGLELDQDQIDSKAYYFASLWVDRIVEETPEDLSIYGLESGAPTRVRAVDSEGKTAEYLLGDETATKSGYYVMEEGSTQVCTVSSYSVENLLFPLSAIREKTLLPEIDVTAMTRLRIEKAGARIDIGPKPDPLPLHLGSTFSTYTLSSPYKILRGVDSEAVTPLIEPFNSLAIQDFVEDSPPSLAPYGLDNPVRVYFEAGDVSIDLLLGGQTDGKRYAKLANAPGVFTLNGMDPIAAAKPFGLMDKFALIVNIDNVERLTVTGGETPLVTVFEGKGDAAVYTLNGKRAETKSFKTYYQAVIGLLSDAEYPGPARNPAPATGDIAIEYEFNTPAGGRTAIKLTPYDRDYYALVQEGTMDFLISRNQVRNIFETAEAVIYE